MSIAESLEFFGGDYEDLKKLLTIVEKNRAINGKQQA